MRESAVVVVVVVVLLMVGAALALRRPLQRRLLCRIRRTIELNEGRSWG